MEPSISASANVSLPKEPPLYEGRVNRAAFEALIGVFYGLAMIAALTRLALQLKTHRRLYSDDCFLIFACICLTGGTVLGYIKVGILYWSQELNYNPSHAIYILADHEDIAAHINENKRLYYSYIALLWAAIFAVKFAYLAFFRRLIDRIRPLVIYWRVIVGVTVIFFPVSIVGIYVSCMKWGLEAEQCDEPVYFHRSLGLAIVDIVLDIGTDLMIIGIPLRLLWSVRIKPSQKFVLGLFLCLNLFMAITASVLVSGLDFRGKIDEVWLFVWQQIEACVAVVMISLTAFHSVFVGTESSRARREPDKKLWQINSFLAFKRKKIARGSGEESMLGLPTIPSATLTGMRSFIQGGRHTQRSHQKTNLTSTSRGEPDEWPLHDRLARAEANYI